ncbi:MAG TPA: hypothetical protein VMZ26_03650 [Pyrinomonadaceae bacterium]|nr:hypothetical protein [Pyrinomonadaceae bacterium]
MEKFGSAGRNVCGIEKEFTYHSQGIGACAEDGNRIASINSTDRDEGQMGN